MSHLLCGDVLSIKQDESCDSTRLKNLNLLTNRCIIVKFHKIDYVIKHRDNTQLCNGSKTIIISGAKDYCGGQTVLMIAVTGSTKVSDVMGHIAEACHLSNEERHQLFSGEVKLDQHKTLDQCKIKDCAIIRMVGDGPAVQETKGSEFGSAVERLVRYSQVQQMRLNGASEQELAAALEAGITGFQCSRQHAAHSGGNRCRMWVQNRGLCSVCQNDAAIKYKAAAEINDKPSAAVMDAEPFGPIEHLQQAASVEGLNDHDDAQSTQLLQTHGVEEDVPGRGNSLFAAQCYGLKQLSCHTNMDHQLLRQQVVKHGEQRGTMSPEYAATMKLPGTSGTDLEIREFVEMTGTSITVVVMRPRADEPKTRLYEPSDGGSARHIALVLRLGHFNAIKHKTLNNRDRRKLKSTGIRFEYVKSVFMAWKKEPEALGAARTSNPSGDQVSI